jgi:MFS family permease
VGIGGRLADTLGRRDMRWYMRLPALQILLAVPLVIGFTLLPQPWQALVCFVPFYTLTAMYVGPMFAMVQGLVEPRMLATAAAIMFFVTNMVGLGLGPLLVGLLNDHVFGVHFGTNGIRCSLLAVGVLGGFASLLFWRASRYLRDELILS